MINYPISFQILATGVEAAIIAQIIKFLGHLIIKRKVDFKLLLTTGGMPSSHSAGVVGLSTLVGFMQGFESIFFAICMGYSLVVMYDAAGLRRSAGKMAASLNKMMDDFYAHDSTHTVERLKELLGHTPLEVIFGALLGAFVAYINFTYIF